MTDDSAKRPEGQGVPATPGAWDGDPWETAADAVPDFFAADSYADDGPPGESQAPGARRQAKSQAVELVEMAREHFTVVRDRDGRFYAVAHDTPGVAIDLRGSNGLRQQIAARYFETRGRVASSAALTDMLNTLEGYARQAEHRPIYLRTAQHDGTVYLDRGTPELSVVAISPAGWTITDSAPILFRRSALTAPLPTPAQAGTLSELRALLNVSDEGFRLMVGWLVAALLPGISHPILSLFGQQGTAKTTAMRTLAGLVDPSVAPVRTPPRDEDGWPIMALHSWVIALDNISVLPRWFQDALCRAVTEESDVRREKYTDDGITVMRYQRVMAMTSIDPGSLQGDLADRMLVVNLDPIPNAQRRTDREIAAAVSAMQPGALAALYDLTARVLAALPSVELAERVRMADFCEVLAALDAVTGWTTLEDFLATSRHTASTVVDGDVFAGALRAFAEQVGTWQGSAAALRELVPAPEGRPPRGWPQTTQAVGGRLARLAPALAQVGVLIEQGPREAKTGARSWHITATSDTAENGDGSICPTHGTPMHDGACPRCAVGEAW